MATAQLRQRDIWQDVSGLKAGTAEVTFFEVFSKEFQGTDFRVRPRPRELKNIYTEVVLGDDILAKIYNPGRTWSHGLIPDFAIDNLKTGKTLYVEVKRQDGWVEGKLPKAGRGNAHERSCEFFTPGLLKILREHGKLGDDVLPFWVVFQGDIARDPKRVREIHTWYVGCPNHFFLWHNSADSQPLVTHFNEKLRYLLS